MDWDGRDKVLSIEDEYKEGIAYSMRCTFFPGYLKDREMPISVLCGNL